jgi:hypothetical protein
MEITENQLITDVRSRSVTGGKCNFYDADGSDGESAEA